jgi:hypothetical protein
MWYHSRDRYSPCHKGNTVAEPRRFSDDVIDAFYAEMTECPGCGSHWREFEGHATVDHLSDCYLLAQYDADDRLDDERARQ